MSKFTNNLDKFSQGLNPAVIADIRLWQGDLEFDALFHRLQHRKGKRGFLDSFAEALVALHARKKGCSVAVEVPTPSGKTSDLLIERDGIKLYVHVKRLGIKQLAHKRLMIPSRLRVLENIQRPWIVKIRWQVGLTDQQMQEYVTGAASFIESARLGDEHVVRNSSGLEFGGVKIVAPNDKERVSLVIGLSEGFQDETPRVMKLLSRAHKQFMPKEANVILICTPNINGISEVETALFGTHIERWDAHPKKGKRVAHGRSDDGFWEINQMKESQFVGWFCLNPKDASYRGELWIRNESQYNRQVKDLVNELFVAR